jgi:hypothetical protein
LLHAPGHDGGHVSRAGEQVDAFRTADGAAAVLVQNKAAEFFPARDAILLIEKGFFAFDVGQRARRQEARVGGDGSEGAAAGKTLGVNYSLSNVTKFPIDKPNLIC